jgi:hypothetical protein
MGLNDVFQKFAAFILRPIFLMYFFWVFYLSTKSVRLKMIAREKDSGLGWKI